LDDPASAWVVYTGKVDVFAVPAREGQSAGVRKHLFQAEVGTVLFGIADLPAGESDSDAPASEPEIQNPKSKIQNPHIALLVSGRPGTQVLQVPLARLQELIAVGQRDDLDELFARSGFLRRGGFDLRFDVQPHLVGLTRDQRDHGSGQRPSAACNGRGRPPLPDLVRAAELQLDRGQHRRGLTYPRRAASQHRSGVLRGYGRGVGRSGGTRVAHYCATREGAQREGTKRGSAGRPWARGRDTEGSWPWPGPVETFR